MAMAMARHRAVTAARPSPSSVFLLNERLPKWPRRTEKLLAAQEPALLQSTPTFDPLELPETARRGQLGAARSRTTRPTAERRRETESASMWPVGSRLARPVPPLEAGLGRASLRLDRACQPLGLVAAP